MNEVKFGIEIETVGRERGTVAYAIASIVGGEAIPIGTPSCYDPWEVRDGMNRVWRIVADASLSNTDFGKRAEIVSPILGWDNIEELQEVVRAVRRCGAHVDTQCGIHIHLSHPNVSVKTLVNLTKMIYKQESIIYKALGVDEYRMRNYCKPIDICFIERLKAVKPITIRDLNTAWYDGYREYIDRYHSSRYHILNLNGFFLRGAVELRAYSGSLHAGEIKAAIHLSIALMVRALNAKTTSSKKRIYNEASGKYDMRVFLTTALKLNGPEFKTTRQHLLRNLTGDTAFKHGRPAKVAKEATV